MTSILPASSLLQLCICGHHKDTHYESKDACCGVYCDCSAYLAADQSNAVRIDSRRNKDNDKEKE